MDSLRLHNRMLNEHISLLVQNFEKMESDTFRREIRWQQETRTHAFRLITGIGIGAFLLAIILYMTVHRDVNRQHKTRMELEASNRRNVELSLSRQNILLTVSHDLCAPLNTINGYAELIPEERDGVQRSRYAKTYWMPRVMSSDWRTTCFTTTVWKRERNSRTRRHFIWGG